MNEEQTKLIKKYNKFYVIELFVISTIFIVLATLKLLGIIGSSENFRHVFNIITLIGGTYVLTDFVWLCFSRKRQKRNCWFDKISLLPFGISLIVFDIICLVHWNDGVSYFTVFVSIAFYYFAAAYIAQGLYHLKKPTPAIVEAALEEYRSEQEKQNTKEDKK